MAYTKNYYEILGLGPPTWRTSTQLDAMELRIAYRSSLLRVHPDKSISKSHRKARNAFDALEDEMLGFDSTKVEVGMAQGSFVTGSSDARAQMYGFRARYTIDDVKEAYKVLSVAKERAKYDIWLAERYEEGVLKYGDGEKGWSEAFSQSPAEAGSGSKNNDFILGLELLDLSDFEMIEVPASNASSPATATPSSSSVSGPGMEYTRSCRCGSGKGFRIMEQELEDASTRGEKEVLVGCEGCSLWVRVGFDVEEG